MTAELPCEWRARITPASRFGYWVGFGYGVGKEEGRAFCWTVTSAERVARRGLAKRKRAAARRDRAWTIQPGDVDA